MKKHILYNGKKIYYSDMGSGIPLILLHGYLESMEVWGSFAEKLSLNFRVLCVDLPGHGLSDIFGEAHSMELMAKSIKELLDQLGIGKIFLTGHSLGGYVTLAFLELFPERLSGYCLFHSHPFADSNETIENRLREIQIVKAGKKILIYSVNVSKMFADVNLKKFAAALERSVEIASRTPDEGIIAILNGMIQRPSRAKLFEQGTIPCLWVLGRMDNYINCDTITAKITLPDSASVIILEESGHMGFIEEEERAEKVVIGFIKSISA